MPRHEFRTIEAFVKWLDDHSDFHAQNGPDVSNSELRGYVKAMREVASLVRSSNIGIVYPPAEQGDKS